MTRKDKVAHVGVTERRWQGMTQWPHVGVTEKRWQGGTQWLHIGVAEKKDDREWQSGSMLVWLKEKKTGRDTVATFWCGWEKRWQGGTQWLHVGVAERKDDREGHSGSMLVWLKEKMTGRDTVATYIGNVAETLSRNRRRGWTWSPRLTVMAPHDSYLQSTESSSYVRLSQCYK